MGYITHFEIHRKKDLVQKRFRHDLAMKFVNLLQCRFKRNALFIDTLHDEPLEYRTQHLDVWCKPVPDRSKKAGKE
jgi:hypothetical protein